MYDKIFHVILDNGEEFIGGDIQFTRWNKCPNSIRSFAVRLPYGDHLTLSGYDSYNFFIGAIKNLNDQKTTISHIYALGKKGDRVTSYRITLVSFEGNKYKMGDITTRVFPFGKEGVGRVSTSGWKQGLIE